MAIYGAACRDYLVQVTRGVLGANVQQRPTIRYRNLLTLYREGETQLNYSSITLNALPRLAGLPNHPYPFFFDACHAVTRI